MPGICYALCNRIEIFTHMKGDSFLARFFLHIFAPLAFSTSALKSASSFSTETNL
jgi:hypothetical protein